MTDLTEFTQAQEPIDFVQEEMKVESPNAPKERNKKGSILDQLTQADMQRLVKLVQAQQDIDKPPKIIKTDEQLLAEKNDLMRAIQVNQLNIQRRVKINYMNNERVHFMEVVK